jgi:type VI secretion system protein VasG
VLRRIVDLKMKQIRRRLLETYKLSLELTSAVGDEVSRRCQQVTIGARLITLIINETVLPEIARRVLEIMGSEAKYERLVIDVKDHEFTYELK